MSIPSWRTALAGAGLVVAATVAHGQTKSPIDHGSWIVAGTANVSHTSTEGNSTSMIALQPSMLYFVVPKLAIGATLDFGYGHSTPVTSYTLGIAPAVRYYTAQLTDKTLPFFGASVGPRWEHQKYEPAGQPSAEVNVTDWQGDVSAGITQLLATHVGLTGEVFYTKEWAHFEGADTRHTNSYGLRFGVTAFVF